MASKGWLSLVGVLGWLLAGLAVAQESQPIDEPPIKMGGTACVMAKWKGSTIDYVFVFGKDHPLEALDEAETIMRNKGYGHYSKHDLEIIHPQTTTNYPFGYVIIVKSVYKTKLGDDRTSYGCGVSPRSYSEAQQRALRDLQNYSWGWYPHYGFEIVEQFSFHGDKRTKGFKKE